MARRADDGGVWEKSGVVADTLKEIRTLRKGVIIKAGHQVVRGCFDQPASRSAWAEDALFRENSNIGVLGRNAGNCCGIAAVNEHNDLIGRRCALRYDF